MENTQSGYILEPQSSQVDSQTRKLIPVFTGSGGEYFRIWIVNVALTVLTLGIYGAWAKVRTRRYFYANTILDGQHFDYLAKPGTILRGHLIVGGAIVVMNVANNLSPLIGYIVTITAWSCIPFLLYKAHRFKAVNSAYRNVRFRFTGDAGGAYFAYAIFPLAAVMSLIVSLPIFLSPTGESGTATAPGWATVGAVGIFGLALAAIYPYLVFLQRRYFHDNMAYGKTDSTFGGLAGPFYGIYLTSLAFIVLALAALFVGGLLLRSSTWLLKNLFLDKGGLSIGAGSVGMILATYLFMVLLFIFVQQYLFASTFNYSWNHSILGPLSFDVTLGAKNLAWIRFTNLIAIFLSLGLLIPWAKVRRARYILLHTAVLMRGDMDAFEADTAPAEGAVGDAAADFFDWDIGW